MINFEEEKLKKIIQRIVRKQGFGNEAEIILSKGSVKGDGYLGEIVSVLVTDEKTRKSLKLIAKIAIKDEKVRDTFPYTEAFTNEILIYKKFLPALLNLQIKSNVPVLFNPAAMFHSASSTINQEYLIMEDLKASNFEMLGIRELLDHEHTKVICQTYGKLHGLSFAMKILQNDKFLEVANELKDVMKKIFTEKMIRLEFPKLWNFIRKVMGENGIENRRLDNYVENSIAMMSDMCSLKEQKYSCFLHGDCWTNNMMFKHEDNNGHKEVTGMKLIDWQAGRIGPPVYDLSYLIYSAGSKEVLANLETYVKIYHETLSRSLSQFNLDVNFVYPFEEMKNQWKKYYHYGAILSGPIWKFRSFNENQGVDPLNYTSDDDSTYFNAIAEAECDSDYLFQHIKILLEHLDEVEAGKFLN